PLELLLFRFLFSLRRPPPRSTLFPYTTLFRSQDRRPARGRGGRDRGTGGGPPARQSAEGHRRSGHPARQPRARGVRGEGGRTARSEEHTSELQSRSDLVCRLLLEKKKNNKLKE